MGDFKGVTFSAQNVTPKDDGALYNAHYGDGILDGCEMAISGDDLVIQPGHIIACGRVCHVDGATSVDLSGRTLQTGYIQVVMNYDLTQGEGQQWYTTFIESATTTFPALTQEDINGVSGTLYQLELAVVQISGGNLTAITSSVFLSRVGQKWTDGVVRSRLFTSNGGGGIQFIDGNGNYSIGVYGSRENNSLWLYSEGTEGIRLNPSGLNSSVGNISFLPSGQQVGGHPMAYASDTASHSLPAYSWQRYAGVSIPRKGIYLLMSAVTCTGAGAGSALRLLNAFGPSSGAQGSTTIHSDLAYGTGNGNTHRNVSLLDISTPDTYYVWLDSQYATTLSRVSLYVVQLS